MREGWRGVRERAEERERREERGERREGREEGRFRYHKLRLDICNDAKLSHLFLVPPESAMPDPISGNAEIAAIREGELHGKRKVLPGVRRGRGHV